MSKVTSRPERNSSRRETGKVGMLQHNKDRLGSNSGPMGREDQRKDKFGTLHNQDPNGLRSDATQLVRNELGEQRQKSRSKRRRLGSR